MDRSDRALVTGFVRDANGSPLNAASVSFDLMKYFDYTDPQGRYVIECPPGEYRVIVRYVGMLPNYLRVRILGNGLLPIQMTEGVIDLETVVISTRARDANVKDALAGVNKLSVPELKVIPTLMGEVDILKALQTLPGVSSVGEGSSGINVRGGRADQNLILVNGAPLFNATHALGFVSGFNQDVLSGFTFYKGNVPANFGGRASAVLDVKFRNGDYSD
ncbi:MAG: carboxypeptidase regulatory-like domain-containing protein, partial [Bacteroidota bacterium]